MSLPDVFVISKTCITDNGITMHACTPHYLCWRSKLSLSACCWISLLIFDQFTTYILFCLVMWHNKLSYTLKSLTHRLHMLPQRSRCMALLSLPSTHTQILKDNTVRFWEMETGVTLVPLWRSSPGFLWNCAAVFPLSGWAGCDLGSCVCAACVTSDKKSLFRFCVSFR